MYRITRKPIYALVLIPLIILIALASACGVIEVEDEETPTPPPVAATTVSPAATSVSTPTVTPTPRGRLAVVPAETVELSVLIEPLDVGYVEIVGSLRLSNGDATEVHRNDQINLIARPVDPEVWRFDRWGGDMQGTFAADALVMDSSKKIRAMFVRVDDRVQHPATFYGVTLNDQPVRNLVIGIDNGSIEVSPAPGPGENPFREGTIVSLLPRPDKGYQLGEWGLDCGGSGPCVLSMNGNKEVTISFKVIRHSLTVAAQPAAGGSASPTGATDHNYGDRVSVTAQPSSGYLFAGFTGDCSGTGSCSVLMDQPRNVTANFNRIPTPTPVPPTPRIVPTPIPSPTPVATPKIVGYILTTVSNPSGGGLVFPSGTYTYPEGAFMIIEATPSSGYTFSNWAGDCSGAGACTVTMNGPMSVTAVFSPVQATPVPSLIAVPTPTPTTISPTPTPTPTPHTPTPAPTPEPITAANDIPGTPLALGATQKSVVDGTTKPRDVYAISLSAGQEVQFGVIIEETVYRKYLKFELVHPDSQSFATGNKSTAFTISYYSSSWSKNFVPPTTGTYYFSISTVESAKAYTLSVVLTGSTYGNGTTANDIPGTPLALGATQKSVVDGTTKPRDVYAISLSAGQEVQFGVIIEETVYRKYLKFELVHPDSQSFATGNKSTAFTISYYSSSWSKNFVPPTTGTYYFSISTVESAKAYTLSVTIF